MRIWLIACLVMVATSVEAYVLNTADILPEKRVVLQAGLVSSGVPRTGVSGRSIMEFKLGYGLTNASDLFFSIAPASLSNGQSVQSLGLAFEYAPLKGKLKAEPGLNMSVVLGVDIARVLTAGSVSDEQSIFHAGVLFGRAPYFGSQVSLMGSASTGPKTDLEILIGYKRALTPVWSVQAETSLHWLRDVGTVYQGIELAVGLVYFL